MKEDTAAALERLKQWFEPYQSCTVAFSGGLDSTFLLAAIKQLTQTKVTAVTAVTDYVPRWEIDEAEKLASQIGVQHTLHEMPIPEQITSNPENRCYLCKLQLFTAMKGASASDLLVDGTNVDDLGDYRPGMRALQELGVRSPLKDCGFTKELIRSGCRALGLTELSFKPAYACLLTRLPHGTDIRPEQLRMIERAERILHELGCPDVRVRVEGDSARIEAGGREFDTLLEKKLLERIYNRMTALGFSRVTLDLGGYRRGSMNAASAGEDA
jgi:uncharacterized protein